VCKILARWDKENIPLHRVDIVRVLRIVFLKIINGWAKTK
jgi:hypothetical protein